MTWRCCSIRHKKGCSLMKPWVPGHHQYYLFFNPFLLPYQAAAISAAEVLPSWPNHLIVCPVMPPWTHYGQTDRLNPILVTAWKTQIPPQPSKTILSSCLRLATPRAWARREKNPSNPTPCPAGSPGAPGAFLPSPHFLCGADKILFLFVPVNCFFLFNRRWGMNNHRYAICHYNY